MRSTCIAGVLPLLLISCAPPSAWNMPPVIGAARSGNTAELERLLAAGADPNVRAGVNGWTPLLHAIHKNREGSVRVLLARGAGVNTAGDGGTTPLIMAAGYGYTNIVRVLLAAGADTRNALRAAVDGVADIDRFTVGHCQAETVRVLLDADRETRLAPTALSKFSGCREVVEMLNARMGGKP